MDNLKPTKTISIENLENGNILFSYKRVRFRDYARFPLKLMLISIIGLLFEYSINNSLFCLIAFSIILIYLTYMLYYVVKMSDKIEENIIKELLTDIIQQDINSFGNNIITLGSRYIHIEDDKNDVRTYTVLLSDGNEIQYQIINQKCYEDILLLEINTKYRKNSY